MPVHPYVAYLNSPAHRWAESLQNYLRQLEGISVRPLMWGPGYSVGPKVFLHILRPGLQHLTIHLWIPDGDRKECLAQLEEITCTLDLSGYVSISMASEEDVTRVFPWIARVYAHSWKMQRNLI